MPALAEHLHSISFSVRALVMPWLMGAFVGSLPLELVLRLWDVMFLEGNTSILFRAALAILDYHAEVRRASRSEAAIAWIEVASERGSGAKLWGRCIVIPHGRYVSFGNVRIGIVICDGSFDEVMGMISLRG